MKKEKVILAFSGGLDTSFCALWLKNQGYQVIAVTLDSDAFSKKDKKQIKLQAKKLGVVKHYFFDGKKDLYDKIVSYIIKGNLLRGEVYPLVTGSERVIIAQKLVKVANQEKTLFASHGSTGAGNDQVRFDVYLKALAPYLKIIAPYRDLEMTRAKEVKYLKKYGISTSEKKKDYSINQSILGTTIGGKETSTSWETLPACVYPNVLPIKKTPAKEKEIIISFSQGMPIAIDGQKKSGISLLSVLNKLGAEYGFGKNIHLGTTILGIKGRLGFEAPGILILIKAHQELEKLVLSKKQLFWKKIITQAYQTYLHEACFFDPLMRDIEALIDSSQKQVTGMVKIQLYKGNLEVLGVDSLFSLMGTNIATYGEENPFWSGKEAAGFCKIYGLSDLLVEIARKKGEKT